MATLSFLRVNTLPAAASLLPSSVYFVRSANNPSIFEMYITGDTTAEVRHVMGPGDIDAAIAEAIANLDGNSLPDIPGSKIISAIGVDTTGNAATATRAESAASADVADLAVEAQTAGKLKTPVNINGTAFDGSADITVPAVDTATPRIPMSGIGTMVPELVDGKIPAKYIPA